MSILEERYGLILERLEEIYQETAAFSDENGRYWHLCAGLALQKGTEDMRFLDYALCGRVFGACGRYLCLLYAQMMQISGFQKNGQTELVCICCELMVQMYRADLDGEELKAFRNTLYWFYSDYCECYIGYWIDRLSHKDALTVGGPMLLMDEKTSVEAVWQQHADDFGLYMGSRFEERCYQAVMLQAEAGKQEGCRVFAKRIKTHVQGLQKPGFGAADRQRDGLLRLTQRIESALSD